MTLAYAEYKRIKNLIAFTITDADRRKVNQYLRVYTFKDGSRLEVYKCGKVIVPFEVIGQLQVNSFGN